MPKGDDILDWPILFLSKSDPLRLRRLVEGGTLITGRLGSGKSSTSGRALAYGFLRAGLGGLVLTVKSDETAHWIEYAKACGREKDLIIFNAASCFSFDPLAYMWTQPGRGAGLIETNIEMFTALQAVGKPQVSVSSESRYFELAVEELMRATLVMLSLAKEPISILSIHRVITSLPTEPGQIEDAEWQQASECAKLVAKIRERKHTLTESQWQDLENALDFTLKVWPNEDPRTRSNVLSTWSGMASKFVYDPLRRMFCSGTYSFTPDEITHQHKIIVIDIPVLEYGREVSRLCQVLIKLVFQRAWLRHQYKPGCCNGAFLFQDEFAFLMHRHENHFHSVCRGSAIAPVCLTQNIMGVAAEEFGETTPGSRTLGFLGNLSVRIFHSQTDFQTCDFAANTLGREYRYIPNYNASENQSGRQNASVGGSLQLVHILEPIEFNRLKSPDGENPCAEAIVWVNGETFNATKTESNPKGRNYLRVMFSREM